MVRNLTAEEMAALAAIRRGDLRPVIPLLAVGDLSPLLQRYLAALLSGDPGQDYRVEVKPRSGVHEKKTQAFRVRENHRAMIIARTVMEMIAAGKAPKEAFFEAGQKHNTNEHKAKRDYLKWRKKLVAADAFMKAHRSTKPPS